jgi:hypothetical protein
LFSGRRALRGKTTTEEAETRMSNVNKDELRRHYYSVPRAGLEIGLSTQQTYIAMQRGKLTGIVVGDRWYVEIKSVEAYKRRQARKGAADTTTAATG